MRTSGTRPTGDPAKISPSGSSSPAAPVRQRLLDAATALFIQKGYAATSVREIIAAAATTRPSLYYYFGNKEGLRQALVGPAVDRIGETITQWAAEPGAARARLLQFGRHMSVLVTEHWLAFRMIDGFLRESPEIGRIIDFDSLRIRMQEHLESVIRQGIESGEFRPAPVNEMALIVLAVLHHWVYLAISSREPSSAPIADLAALVEHVQLGLLDQSRSPAN